MRSTLARWLTPAHAALFALALILSASACHPQLPSGEERMGAVATRTGTPGGGSMVATAFDEVGCDATATSDVIDMRGYQSGATIEIVFAGVDADTDLVSTIEILSGNTDDADAMGTTPIDATWVLTGTGTTLPTGLTIDVDEDGFAVAATFATNTRLRLPYQNLPPFLALRHTHTSGGTDCTLSATVRGYN